MKITNYLDITLNLTDCPYRSHRNSNPTKKPTISTSIQIILHQLLKKFYSQLKNILNFVIVKKYFEESVVYYEKCLKNSGYKTKLQYQQPKENNQNKKKRKRNIIWFNLPYSKSFKTNIGRIFIKLINKHFPPNHKFVKIFNKNTINFSYSCMPNMRSKINGHNKKNTTVQAHRFTKTMQLLY